MNKRLVTTLVLASSVFAMVGCSKSSGGSSGGSGSGSSASGGSGSGSGGKAATGGSGGSSSSGGSGGQTGSGGSTGSAGSGGTAAAAPVMCGSAMCTGGGFFKACCKDATMSTCGVESSLLNVKCDVPGVPDPRCPDKPAAMGRTSQGCCTKDNLCGSMLMGSPCIVVTPDGGTPMPCQ
jgi:hypothetical protein